MNQSLHALWLGSLAKELPHVAATLVATPAKLDRLVVDRAVAEGQLRAVLKAKACTLEDLLTTHRNLFMALVWPSETTPGEHADYLQQLEMEGMPPDGHAVLRLLFAATLLCLHDAAVDRRLLAQLHQSTLAERHLHLPDVVDELWKISPKTVLLLKSGLEYWFPQRPAKRRRSLVHADGRKRKRVCVQ